MNFKLIKTDNITKARCGRLELPRGGVDTPAFMPVGTLASVKGLTPHDLNEVGSQIILGNTYHLMLRPGEELVRRFGGISNFMAWKGPVLTDSGGYQVFSLSGNRKITEEGVKFKSHIDGSEHFLSPERAVEIQNCLNSDIMMVLDECPPLEMDKGEVAESLAMTHRWAKRCLEHKRVLEEKEGKNFNEPENVGKFLKVAEQSLFPIVQGGLHLDLRAESASCLAELDAPGYAIGGVSVGEGPEYMKSVVEHTAPLLPCNKPRYLMGVGHPRDLLMGIGAGIDMFDCVLPTRNGRNGGAFTLDGSINLRNAIHKDDHGPVDDTCDCYACRNFSRGYLRHLFIAGEMLASQAVSVHNVRFLLSLMEKARERILKGDYAEFAESFTRRYMDGENRRKNLSS
jgi:queuine tRNA-ribosyltransferase